MLAPWALFHGYGLPQLWQYAGAFCNGCLVSPGTWYKPRIGVSQLGHFVMVSPPHDLQNFSIVSGLSSMLSVTMRPHLEQIWAV